MLNVKCESHHKDKERWKITEKYSYNRQTAQQVYSILNARGVAIRTKLPLTSRERTRVPFSTRISETAWLIETESASFDLKLN